MNEAEIVRLTREWVQDNFLYMRPNWALQDTDPMLATGVIDSVGVIELVEFLQRTFGISIADEEITERNVGSLSAVGRYVAGKCRLDAGAGERARQVA